MSYTLHFTPGTCARVPLVALAESGAEFDVKHVQLMKGEHKRPDYLAKNLAGKVPLLETPEGASAQNVAIARYLGSKFPQLLPQTDNAFADAKITANLAFCADTLHPIVTRMRMPMFIADGDEAQQSVREKGHAAMVMMAKVVEDQLANGPWWYGDEWSIQDAYIYWIWFRLLSVDYDVSVLPNWAAHAARMEERPAVQRALKIENDLLEQSTAQ
ncbi:MAG: glutathione S-transferase family protein [Pacificibacter sp.]|uniref:glutathione S-transferase family protein n=1 Tax=Pacificibacter sp. TaxID=1917866 RepID=UPI003219EF97